MDWNDTLTLIILADTVLTAKLLVGGYFLWRWWQKREWRRIMKDPNTVALDAHWNGVVAQETGAVNYIGYVKKEDA